MAVFLVFTILFHITMTRSIGPLLYALPRTLETEETAIQASGDELGAAEANKESSNDAEVANGVNGESSKKAALPNGNDYGLEKKKKGNMFTRFLKPWIFSDYATLRHMVPKEENINFAQLQAGVENERNAYFPPSVNSQPPQLWIPRDLAGVSKHEIALTSKVIPITDNGAHLDEKNHVIWSEDLSNEEDLPPIYQEKVYY
jgi:hypothetical protein